MLKETFSCDDVLLVPRYSKLSSRKVCDISSGEFGMPIISAPMDKVYSKELDKYLVEKEIPTTVHRYFNSYEEQLSASYRDPSPYRFFSVGSVSKYKDWIDGLVDSNISNFLVDMAHGDSKQCVDTVEYIKKKHPTAKVIAGNVATSSGFQRLQRAGAWAIRVGIGSGSACSTRANTGFGVPLLTAVQDCAMVKENALLIADGGIKSNGDIMKAIAFGADLVMLGKMFAATSLAPGKCFGEKRNFLCEYNDASVFMFEEYTKYKEYRGMASEVARKGVLKESSVEGVSGLISYVGKTEDFVIGIENNMRSALGYAGAKDWKQFEKRVKAVRISNSAIIESQTHLK